MDFGAVGQYMQMRARALAEQGHDVTLINRSTGSVINVNDLSLPLGSIPIEFFNLGTPIGIMAGIYLAEFDTKGWLADFLILAAIWGSSFLFMRAAALERAVGDRHALGRLGGKVVAADVADRRVAQRLRLRLAHQDHRRRAVGERAGIGGGDAAAGLHQRQGIRRTRVAH